MARFANLPRAFPAAAGLDPTILAGRWLVVARIAWLAIAVVAVGLTLAAAPVELGRLTTVCAGNACPDPHLTPSMAASRSTAPVTAPIRNRC